ncbi:MAG: DUF4129 domain-containing protein [Sphingopyxis sp.]
MAGTGFCAVGRTTRLGLGLFATMLFAAAPSAQAKGVVADPQSVDTRVQSAIDRIQADPGYQLEFAPQPVPPRPPEWLKAFFEWLSGAGQWFVYGVAGLLIGAALLFVLYLTVPGVREAVDRLRARFRRAAEEPEENHWQPDEDAARNLLADADALASKGRYGEAVHLLMGRSVEDIARRRPGVLKPALTARAIALLGDLPLPARTAFGRIAAAVERSLWARQVIALGEWSDARAAYEDFAFGAHWRTSAA